MWAGLGDDIPSSTLSVRVYIANRPPMMPYDSLAEPLPLQAGEIYSIAQYTGNHWRKIFNVYAKLMHGFFEQSVVHKWCDPRLTPLISQWQEYTSWQAYRDALLLQAGSGTQLRFSKLNSSECLDGRSLNIIMGKGYAETLGFACDPMHMVQDSYGDFAYYEQDNVLVCPYFDYRQLSNAKIDILITLMWRALQTRHQKPNNE